MILQFDDFDITPINTNDAWALCDLMITNSDRFKRFFPGTLKDNLNPTLSQLFVEKKLKQFQKKEEFLFTLKVSQTSKLIGLIYIKALDWSINQGEFAYCIDYNYKGQGIISKAITALSNYAFTSLDLKTLQIIAHKDNLPSVNVATNNGFQWIKTLKNECTPTDDNPLDMELYELHNL
ncbi:GNAT family N-acetyltransferase [Psychroserpens sp. NJDZ02]|uniref:GNAT family N-acetyltransferase n=1 Tax=Psychroserpens sp. NJDZ02 TaxID=2570561 RepID=UPI0010A81A91|nr:GNAT family protein [Psychroserpens sp. NJDZ02]QCE41076.1 GNAT family N-acetyltransferase [Psychroserpens sp. NJDZ02]